MCRQDTTSSRREKVVLDRSGSPETPETCSAARVVVMGPAAKHKSSEDTWAAFWVWCCGCFVGINSFLIILRSLHVFCSFLLPRLRGKCEELFSCKLRKTIKNEFILAKLSAFGQAAALTFWIHHEVGRGGGRHTLPPKCMHLHALPIVHIYV